MKEKIKEANKKGNQRVTKLLRLKSLDDTETLAHELGQKRANKPWLAWLSGLSAGLQTNGSQV